MKDNKVVITGATIPTGNGEKKEIKVDKPIDAANATEDVTKFGEKVLAIKAAVQALVSADAGKTQRTSKVTATNETGDNTAWYDSIGTGFKEHFTEKVDAVKALVNNFQEKPVATALSITIPVIITSASNQVAINQSVSEGEEYGNYARETILYGTSEEKFELLGDVLAVGTEYAIMYGIAKVGGKILSGFSKAEKGSLNTKIPSTLTQEEIDAAKAVDLRAQAQRGIERLI